MRKFKFLFTLNFLIFSSICFCNEENNYHTQSWGWLKRAPSNLYQLGHEAIDKKNRNTMFYLAALTGVLIYYDQVIIDKSQQFSRHIGLLNDNQNGRETNTTTLFSVNGTPVPFHRPSNAISGMYYLGDGLVQVPIMAGFLSYGLIAEDNKAVHTSSLIAESLLITGITVQLLKRSFGREAPFVATKDRGTWRPFPDFNEYNSNVPHYDAMPSGHLATVMATTTVIAGMYPNHRYIWPTGYTVMGLLGFGMLVNGVHWASDYPLGLAIGYTAGKIVLNNSQRQSENNSMVIPQLMPDGIVFKMTKPF
ncbi:MAG: membrane-associated phospholipid phosphatase [Oceanicoccus sp.]|jgi:membrane-associated phospholipid phosphatase